MTVGMRDKNGKRVAVSYPLSTLLHLFSCYFGFILIELTL